MDCKGISVCFKISVSFWKSRGFPPGFVLRWSLCATLLLTSSSCRVASLVFLGWSNCDEGSRVSAVGLCLVSLHWQEHVSSKPMSCCVSCVCFRNVCLFLRHLAAVTLAQEWFFSSRALPHLVSGFAMASGPTAVNLQAWLDPAQEQPSATTCL